MAEIPNLWWANRAVYGGQPGRVLMTDHKDLSAYGTNIQQTILSVDVCNG